MRFSRSSARSKDNVEDKQNKDREADRHVRLAPGSGIYERNVETKREIYPSWMALDTTLIFFQSLPTDVASTQLAEAASLYMIHAIKIRRTILIFVPCAFWTWKRSWYLMLVGCFPTRCAQTIFARPPTIYFPVDAFPCPRPFPQAFPVAPLGKLSLAVPMAFAAFSMPASVASNGSPPVAWYQSWIFCRSLKKNGSS